MSLGQRLARVLSLGMLSMVVLSSALLPAAGNAAELWNRFRGDNGSGTSSQALPADWSQRDFEWQVKLPGIGHSSPVLWGSRLFVTSGDEATGERILECRDTRTGQVHWERRFPVAVHRKHKLNSFASSTPAVDQRHVYWCWATPDQFLVTALDHQGQQVWQRDLGPYQAGHGGGVSPMLCGDRVIVASQHNGASGLFALNCGNGEIDWQLSLDSKSHYSTPCVFAPPGRAPSLIMTNWEQGIMAVDPATGRTIWQADVFDKEHWESAIGSPVVAGDLVLGVCGYLGYGNEVVAVKAELQRAGTSSERQEVPSEDRKGSDGEPAAWTARKVWRLDRGAPLCTTPLVKDDLVFLWSDNGIVTCADVQRGQVHWRQRIGGTCYASPIALGDQVLNVTADGELIALAASSTFREPVRRSLGEPSHSTPAAGDGRIFIRTFSQLFALRTDTRQDR